MRQICMITQPLKPCKIRKMHDENQGNKVFASPNHSIVRPHMTIAASIPLSDPPFVFIQKWWVVKWLSAKWEKWSWVK